MKKFGISFIIGLIAGIVIYYVDAVYNAILTASAKIDLPVFITHSRLLIAVTGAALITLFVFIFLLLVGLLFCKQQKRVRKRISLLDFLKEYCRKFDRTQDKDEYRRRQKQSQFLHEFIQKIDEDPCKALDKSDKTSLEDGKKTSRPQRTDDELLKEMHDLLKQAIYNKYYPFTQMSQEKLGDSRLLERDYTGEEFEEEMSVIYDVATSFKACLSFYLVENKFYNAFKFYSVFSDIPFKSDLSSSQLLVMAEKRELGTDINYNGFMKFSNPPIGDAYDTIIDKGIKDLVGFIRKYVLQKLNVKTISMLYEFTRTSGYKMLKGVYTLPFDKIKDLRSIDFYLRSMQSYKDEYKTARDRLEFNQLLVSNEVSKNFKSFITVRRIEQFEEKLALHRKETKDKTGQTTEQFRLEDFK